MKTPWWTAWRERERQRQVDIQRRVDAWADGLIDVWERHRFNEDTVLAGDPPYYDCCPAVGDGHTHITPDWPFNTGWAAPTKRSPKTGSAI